MNFNLDIKIINDLLNEELLIPLKKELKLFPKKSLIGQNLLKAGYEIGLKFKNEKISSRLGFIGEIGFLYIEHLVFVKD